MEQQTYLIFSSNGARYGVETRYVQEIFFLPLLKAIEEAPPDIVGVLNLRGEILPVMDLNLRFGHRSQNYKITDSIIVLEWKGVQMGLLVNQVHEVQQIGSEEIAKDLNYGRQMDASSHRFICGMAKIMGDLVMLLNPAPLIEHSETSENVEPSLSQHSPSSQENSTIETPQLNFIEGKERSWRWDVSAEDMAIFQQRAQNLMQPTDTQDFTGLMPIAVVGLNGEYFGIDLNIVREFTDIRQITPIPCCPDRILGNMNLRGEIITLLDIRAVLNMPMSSISEGSKAMVVHLDDLIAGITIEEVCDVMYLHPSELTPVPAAVHSANDEYLRGTAPYREKMMSLLDLPKILTRGELEVNEDPGS
ncbi:chemotaxis protein CheW [Phormidium sp. CCY1219]|uniref:chemotaxis protein CheW n=1 Tax=Phormidium sp. CCY1219 TaxID=2886104 RepID=UPI002D1F1312|nr:chemotaxis protein CheW [Phormidium sp. CCY1219]MEB3827083.1 chemotaxis protein CheW [Phormidium sp. CCY1219]